MKFLENVVASLVGGALLLLIGGFFSKNIRWVFTAAFGRFLGIDTDFVFSNPRDAAPDVVGELQKALTVRLLMGRGNELQREAFKDMLSRASQGLVKPQIMLPSVTPRNDPHDWVKQRENELVVFDHAYGNDLLRTQIQTNVTFLSHYVKSKFAELRELSSNVV